MTRLIFNLSQAGALGLITGGVWDQFGRGYALMAAGIMVIGLTYGAMMAAR